MTLNPNLKRISVEAVPVRTTYLEMTEVPDYVTTVPDPDRSLKKWIPSDVREYLELFAAVGSPWGWTGRLLKSPDEVQQIIRDPRNYLYQLRVDGEVAGFSELNAGEVGTVELSYMGLKPEWIGRGVGRALLEDTVRKAWELGPRRVWVHTCEYDHESALAAYQRCGFKIYQEKVDIEPYPTEFLVRHRRRISNLD